MKVTALHHVRFAVTDLGRTAQFASDFGLQLARKDAGSIVMRTNGGDAFCYVAEAAAERGFRGLAFAVAGPDQLEEAVARHGATPIRDLDTPGGGRGVTLLDPEGIRIDLVTGIVEQPHPVNSLQPAPLQLNVPGRRLRQHVAQSTRELQPAVLFRLGHVGVYVKDFARMCAWYQEVLGLKVSDTIYAGDPQHKIVGFLRIDRGAELVDHHTLFFVQSGKTDCHHISFEIQDFEAQFMAHRWLEQRGWTPNWGVGRHPLGSHVFDVWFDPDRYRFETFSDTDVVDGSRAPGNHDITTAHMDLWSSDSPERYFA